MKTDNNDSKHTPTPWTHEHWVKCSDGGDIPKQIYGGLNGNRVEIATIDWDVKAGVGSEMARANAALIVRAVNNLEANEKRIKELERKFTEAVASIENLNSCLDKMWNDKSSDRLSESHIREITQAQIISRSPVDKWYSDPVLNQPMQPD